MTSKDYKSGKIYCIRNNVDDDIYVGSTCQPISKRMAKHRGYINDKRQQHRMLYVKMVEHGVDNFYIELVEDCPCDNLEQLRRREGHFIRNMGTLNKNIAGRTESENKAQYYIEHKEHLDEVNKQYRESHPDEMKQYCTDRYERNKEEQSRQQKKRYQENKQDILQKQKIYRDSHEEQLKDYMKQYITENKEKLKAWKSTPNTCECGGRYVNSSKSKHIQSKLHQNYLNTCM